MFIIKNKLNRSKKIASFYNRIKKTKTMMFFLGKKINRLPMMYERQLMFLQKFRLIKTNNYKLSEMLKIHPLLRHLSFGIGGYNLIAITKRKKSLQQLIDLFNLPYKNIVPLFVLTNKTFYSAERLNKYATKHFSKKHLPVFFAIHPVFVLVFSVNKFLYSKIHLMNLKNDKTNQVLIYKL